ncbi:MAG TPA: tryptophan 7-halogenase [Gemmatimonadaceae bacterium]|nr:tryptophan 7-halogenase [Gemmatimonadaceae bacterium]
MRSSCEIAIVGSGFAGSLLARVLAVLGYDVALLERGTHPRFAIGESSTPLANLSLERIGIRYGLDDCYQLATHGRWLKHFPHLERGLKRGFTFYRHHPAQQLESEAFAAERLLVAASPNDELSDSHWLRADIDHHFVREAVAAGVDYRDRAEIARVELGANDVLLSGSRDGMPLELSARFVVDASGPGGFLARQLSIPSALHGTHTRSSLLYSHFAGARMIADVLPHLPAGPYPDDWAAVHHIIDEGWMYSLRFDDGVTSAGFLLTPRGAGSVERAAGGAEAMWRELLRRYPLLDDAFHGATAVMPVCYRRDIQHRLARAGGERWLLMPHAFAFVDPLFSTGIAWSLRAVERLALELEYAAAGARVPGKDFIARYEQTISAEADQIDLVVAGAYEAMAHFDLFVAQAMLYFAAVSYAEASQRLAPTGSDAWSGFLGVGDPVLNGLPAESFARLTRITSREGSAASPGDRKKFVKWLTSAIEPRNIAGLADHKRANLYPVDFEALVEGHDRLGMSRAQVLAALPRLRGMSAGPELPGERRRKLDLAQKADELPFFPRAEVAQQHGQQESGNGAG